MEKPKPFSKGAGLEQDPIGKIGFGKAEDEADK